MRKNIKAKIIALAIALSVTSSGALAASNPKKDDLGTINQVRKEILKLPYYGVFDSIGFKVEGETVTLFGSVVRPSTRKDAERRVAKLESVDRVINQIQVLPLSRFDDTIRVRAYRSIANTGGLYRYVWANAPAIHIIVRNGHVTLEGNVSNEGDKRLATFAVNSIPGVFSVTNNLRVERRS
jgi:hyperosmotically inducible periplasmic protein